MLINVVATTNHPFTWSASLTPTGSRTHAHTHPRTHPHTHAYTHPLAHASRRQTEMAAAVSEAAVAGFANANAYYAHRPSYPAAAVADLLARAGIAGQAGARVVDLAAGTGKFTELLAARPEGFDVCAVEPVATMREALAAKGLPLVTVASGVATRIDLPDGWADAVFAAQSFHWFAHEEALQEIRRVLKPGGTLTIIWNIEDYNQPRKWEASTPWEAQIKELVLNLDADGTSRFRDDKWWHVFDRQAHAANPLFSTPVGQEKLAFAIQLSKERLWDRVATLSQVATMQGPAKAAFRARFDEIVREADESVHGQGSLEIHGATVYAWTTRL